MRGQTHDIGLVAGVLAGALAVAIAASPVGASLWGTVAVTCPLDGTGVVASVPVSTTLCLSYC